MAVQIRASNMGSEEEEDEEEAVANAVTSKLLALPKTFNALGKSPCC